MKTLNRAGRVRVTVWLKLEIEADAADDAYHVVDALLDAGFFQDAINDHDVDECGALHVTSAVARMPPAPAPALTVDEARAISGLPPDADDQDDACSDPGGHEWHEGEPDRMDEGPIRCIHCGADGDA